MLVKNTEENRKLQQVLATMAIEDMYLDPKFVEELMKVSRGEKSSEQLRQEVVEKYNKRRLI